LNRIKPVEEPNSESDCGPEYRLPESDFPRRFLNMTRLYRSFCHDDPLWKLVDDDEHRHGYLFPLALDTHQGLCYSKSRLKTQRQTDG